MTSDKKNLIQNILYEARAYNTFEDIEKLVDGAMDLSMIPVQPLYVSLMSTSADQVATILPKLSPEQRQILVDLDLWNKDVVDVNSFEYWIETYSICKDEGLVQEFVQTEDFLLYLKSRVNIHTFDQEDPQYPDHDNYFLTDDTQLLIEYADEFTFAAEVKYLIRNLYSVMGVDKAYTTLFKLINDSFSYLQENGYSAKKERLRDYGFVDYYEALEKLHPFARRGQIKKFVENKVPLTGSISVVGQNQSLHSSALVSFDSSMENILKELSKVKDEKRQQFLHFTFIRLINSTITLTDSLRGGRIELTKLGKQTKALLELSIQYIYTIKKLKDESVFDYFDFFDVYKIGKSLIQIEQSRIKKSLKDTPFEETEFEYFLGAWWSSFLDNSFLEIPKTKTFGAGLHAKEIDDLPTYEYWRSDVLLFTELVPFINQFHEGIHKLKKEGLLNDSYYLNYEIDNIDFEAIILSSFINYCLGHFSKNDVNKMGLSIQELQKFLSLYFSKDDKGEFNLLAQDNEKMKGALNGFIEAFGFNEVKDFDAYLYGILGEHLGGYEFDTLENDDFQHVGGPILLALQTKN